jgi:type III secretion system YopN/LcrE/InvE/MxiC family regulator
MVASINATGVYVAAPSPVAQRQHDTWHETRNDSGNGSGNAAAENIDDSDDDMLLTLQQKLADMADDMANVATQFRNRRDIEKKSGVSDDDFESVLDDDQVEKSQKIIQVVGIENTSLDDILAQVRSLFPDESDLFLVIKKLLKQKKLSEIQCERLEQVLAEVACKTDPKILKGGINCAFKARFFGAKLGLAARYLRQTYRRFLQSGRRPLEDYEDWIACYGFQQRHIVSDFVAESLSTDIRSEDPSCSLLEFGNLLAHMRKLHLLRTADKEFVTALSMKRIVPFHGNGDADWLSLLFDLLRPGTDLAERLPEVLDSGCFSRHAARSIWLIAVRNAYSFLSPELKENWNTDNDSVHESVEATVLAAFDHLIEQSHTLELRESHASFRKLMP